MPTQRTNSLVSRSRTTRSGVTTSKGRPTTTAYTQKRSGGCSACRQNAKRRIQNRLNNQQHRSLAKNG